MFTSDWHWHSRNSCDCKGGKIPTTMAESAAAIRSAGITDFGVTDHLHTPLNIPDIEASRREFEALQPMPGMHFGIEVSCVSEWELAQISAGGHDDAVYGLRSGGPPDSRPALGIGAEDLKRLKAEYVVGGTHWPLYVPYERDAIIRDYHRQNMFLASNPLVDIVAHPWWWMGHWQDADGCYRGAPWFDDFEHIPKSMHDDFAAAARQSETVVEINLYAVLLNDKYPDKFKIQYAEYLAGLKSAGVRLSIGSDYHSQHHRYGESTYWPANPDGPSDGIGEGRGIVFGAAVAMLESVGIRDADLWRLHS